MATVLGVTTNNSGAQVATISFKTVSPWISTAVRFLEVLAYAAVAAGVEYLISYAQAGKLTIDPVMVGVIIAALSAIAKLIKEKQRDVDIQSVAAGTQDVPAPNVTADMPDEATGVVNAVITDVTTTPKQ